MIAVPELVSTVVLFVTAALATTAATPVARVVALRTGLVDHPAPHKFHQSVTPYLGGAAIAGAVLAILLAPIALAPALRVQLVAIALGGAAVSAVGLLDDWRTLRALPRVAVQAAAGAGLWAAGIRVGPTGVTAIDFAATVFVVLAVTNAVNLLDNMDGLSAGTTAIASIFFFLIAQHEGQQVVALMTIVLAGACLGFLPYNFPPARIFLGDAGTLFLGFLLAVSAIKLRLHGVPVVTRGVVPFLVLAVPLFDTTLVVLSRLAAKRPVFQGGTDHSSHRLVMLGMSVRRTALVTYSASVGAGVLALLLLRVESAVVVWAVVVAVALLGAALLVLLEDVYRRGRSGVEPASAAPSPDLAPVPARS